MRTIIFTLCIIAGIMNAGFAQNYTLEEAINYGLENHNSIKESVLDIRDAEMQVKEYWAIGLPKVNATAGMQYFFEIPTQIIPDFITPTIDNRLLDYHVNTVLEGVLDDPSKFRPYAGSGGVPAQFGTSNNLTLGLEAQALVFDGSFLVGLKAQKKYKELVSAQAELPKRDIRANVTETFLSVLVAEKSKLLLEENVENISSLLDETKEVYKNGFIEKLDVDRLQLTKDNLSTEILNMNRSITLAKNVLKLSMGYPMEEDITIIGDLEKLYLDRQLDAVDTTWSFADRIEYGLLNQGIALQDINIRRFKVGALPRVVASANYSRALQTEDLFSQDNVWYPTGVVGLGLSLPLYDGGDRKSKMARAKIERERMLIQKSDLERGISLEIKNSISQYNNAVDILQQRENNQKLAREIYETTLIKYKEGVGSSLEVSQAESDWLSSQSNYISAMYQLLQSRVQLEKSTGKI